MMNANLSLSDISVYDAEPRILDLRLAEALEFSDKHKIRDLIQRNIEELRAYGLISATMAEIKTNSKNPKGAGRLGTEYHLNEGQSLLITMFSRTPKAAEKRKEIANVFMAFRHGALQPNPSPATLDDEPSQRLNSKINLVRLAEKLYGGVAARKLWHEVGLPLIDQSKGGRHSIDQSRACLEHFLKARYDAGQIIMNVILEVHDYAIMEPYEEGQKLTKALKKQGVRLFGEMVWVAKYSPLALAAFAGSIFHDNWFELLSSIPCAAKGGVHKVGATAQRGVLIPLREVEAFDPSSQEKPQLKLVI